jgi:hypothetical protein
MTPRKIAMKCAALCREMADVSHEVDRSMIRRRAFLDAQERLQMFATTQPDVEERSQSERALDALCEASGYQYWWIVGGRLLFGSKGENGNATAIPAVALLAAQTMVTA